MIDYAVVGSGIGGSSIAAYLDAQGYRTVLFEKEPYLGGCSSTFTHKGYKYNSGATTLAGYQDGHIVKTAFDAIGFKPKVISTDPAIVIVQNGKVTPRYRNLDAFLDVLNQNYPHPHNEKFWRLVYKINQSFFEQQGHYYSGRTGFKKLLSLFSYTGMFFKFQKYLFQNAEGFIQNFFGNISPEYKQFMESQVLIVAQAPCKEINFLTAALALGYTFNKTHYAVGGFGKLFDEMTASMSEVKTKSEITSIQKENGHYLLHTSNDVYKAKNVILNSTVYDNAKLFDDEDIRSYYRNYGKLNNYQSSFMLYMTVECDKPFEHHYQLIQNEPYPDTFSNALFVSVSDARDNTIAPEGHYSITASIHTYVRWWITQDGQKVEGYRDKKQRLQKHLQQSICDILGIREDEIVQVFSATPRTFARYINRAQLGGNAITMKNLFPKLPANDTPFQGLYQVGDTVYAAQGWPGVMLGVENLKKLLHG